VASPAREDIAKRYGFECFSDLLDISSQLPMAPGDKVQAYVARHKDGQWFVWEDELPGPTLEDPESLHVQ
jgi:hypothetical protein